MKIKTIPNETVGLYTCFDENLPKATVEAERVVNEYIPACGMISLPYDLNNFINLKTKAKQ